MLNCDLQVLVYNGVLKPHGDKKGDDIVFKISDISDFKCFKCKKIKVLVKADWLNGYEWYNDILNGILSK